MLLSIFRLDFYILSLIVRIWVTSITSPEKSAEVKFSCIQEIQRYPLWNILFFVRVVCFKGFQLPFFSTKMKYINSICDLPEKPQPPPLAFDIPRIKKKKKRKRDQGINAIKLSGQPSSVFFNSLDVAAPYPLSPPLPPPPLLTVYLLRGGCQVFISLKSQLDPVQSRLIHAHQEK